MSVAELIYQTARTGSPKNPGLPVALSWLLVAQARHETDNFTSNFYRNYNNLFGYSYVPGAAYQSGPGTVADNGQPIASYPYLKNSVYELIDWIYRRQKENKFPADLSTIVSPEQYAQLLKSSGYYGDTLENYTAGLKRFFLENKTGVSIASVLFVAGLLYFLIKKTR